jgi:hypothetical protein
MPQIVIRLKDRELQRFTLVGVATRIGRDAANDVVIANDGISRHHATLRYEAAEGAFVIYDASSSNGIYVRGRPTPYARLVDGDEVLLGKFTLVFEAAGGVSPDKLAPDTVGDPVAPARAVQNPLPTMALPSAVPRIRSSRPGAVDSSRPSSPFGPPVRSTPPTATSLQEPPAIASSPPPAAAAPEGDVLVVQARMLRHMVWLLVVLVALLIVLIAIVLRR